MLVAALLAGACASAPNAGAAATRATHDVSGLVALNVTEVLLVAGQPAVLLLDEPQERYLLIFIDLFMANAIRMGLRGEHFERPLTHDLFTTLLQRVGARVRHVAITDVRDNTYFARLALQVNDGEETELDVRPSDGLAIAVRVEAAVYAAAELLTPVEQGPLPAPEPPEPPQEAPATPEAPSLTT